MLLWTELEASDVVPLFTNERKCTFELKLINKSKSPLDRLLMTAATNF